MTTGHSQQETAEYQRYRQQTLDGAIADIDQSGTEQLSDETAQGDINPSSLPFTLHITGADEFSLETCRAQQPTTLVVTPVQLHQRNIETQLRERAAPMSSLLFSGLRGIAEALLDAVGESVTAADRVDRLLYVARILADSDKRVYDHLGAVIGEPLAEHADAVERARGELELVTGYHPQRMQRLAEAVRSDAEMAGQPAATETLDLLAGVSHLHEELRACLTADAGGGSTAPTLRVTSETALLAHATRRLAATPEAWSEAFETIDRVVVAGMSMLTAPLEDFLCVVATRTDVDVHLYLRAASGPVLASQLTPTAPIESPGLQEVFSWR